MAGDLLLGQGQDPASKDERNPGPSGDEPAPHPAQEPPDTRGELLGLGARERHAVVHRVEEAALPHPPLLLN